MALSIKQFSLILMMGFIFVMSIGLANIFFIALYDYGYIPTQEIAEDLNTSGLLSNNWMTLINNFIPDTQAFIQMTDWIFIASLVGLVSIIWMMAYQSSRIGYFTLFGFMTFGIMVFLFVSSLFESISQYFYSIFFEVILVNVINRFVFLPFYISNLGLINMIILSVAIFLNFVDLNFAQFFTRKQKEAIINVEDTEL